MEFAAFIGISILDFWDITPFELSIVAKGYAKRKELERKESTYQSYLISRWVWAKRVNIEKILKSEKKKRVMTDEEMFKKVRILNNLFGGNEESAD